MSGLDRFLASGLAALLAWDIGGALGLPALTFFENDRSGLAISAALLVYFCTARRTA